ncbi:hypothetical protein CRG98_014824, partial [Punica granatum]
MASAVLTGADNLALVRAVSPKGLGFLGSDFHGKHLPRLALAYSRTPNICSFRIT